MSAMNYLSLQGINVGGKNCLLIAMFFAVMEWNILPKEKNKSLPSAEKDRILAEEVFPKIQKQAELGKAPATWRIGFFHLYGNPRVIGIDRGRTGTRHDRVCRWIQSDPYPAVINGFAKKAHLMPYKSSHKF